MRTILLEGKALGTKIDILVTHPAGQRHPLAIAYSKSTKETLASGPNHGIIFGQTSMNISTFQSYKIHCPKWLLTFGTATPKTGI